MLLVNIQIGLFPPNLFPGSKGKLEKCDIILAPIKNCYVGTSEAVKISEIVMWHMNETNPNCGKAKFQYFYDDVDNKGRYIIWGNPHFIGKVLSAVSEVIE